MVGVPRRALGAAPGALALLLFFAPSGPAAGGEPLSGPAEIFADGFESGDTARWGVNAACPAYVSTEEEVSPVQIAGAGLPARHDLVRWSRPTTWTWMVPFSGVPGLPAEHEGTDYVHDDPGVPEVPVHAAADGQVVYVRLGCPQSAEFTPNDLLRECGAGWGNHVVVLHGHGIHTRYAHLEPGQTVVEAGAHVLVGDLLGSMGNSGRSNVRHLHLELGTSTRGFDPCAPAQSMELVFDPEALPWQ